MTSRRLLCLSLVGCLCGASLFAEDPAPPTELRILSYNIHHGEGVDGKLDLPRIAQVILAVKPDLVALQEVDQGCRRTNGVDQPAELAKLTGMQIAFGPNIEFQGGKFGNAVLSRWPIDSHKNHLLPNYDDGEQRGVLVVTTRHPDFPDPIRLFATHLDFRKDDRERVDSAIAINKLSQQINNGVRFLAGDLNADPTSRPLKEFEKVWQRSNDKILPTVPVATPRTQIDYVLSERNAIWIAQETTVLEEAVASDHRAILAVYRLATRKELEASADGDPR